MGVVHGQEMVLNIGPQHPATHGVLRLQVKTDGEVISEITPDLGYLHRCFEKHCENVSNSPNLKSVTCFLLKF